MSLYVGCIKDEAFLGYLKHMDACPCMPQKGCTVMMCLEKNCSHERYIVPLTGDQVDTLDRMQDAFSCHSFPVFLEAEQIYQTRREGTPPRERPPVDLMGISALALMAVSTEDLKAFRDRLNSVLDDRVSHA